MNTLLVVRVHADKCAACSAAQRLLACAWRAAHRDNAVHVTLPRSVLCARPHPYRGIYAQEVQVLLPTRVSGIHDCTLRRSHLVLRRLSSNCVLWLMYSWA